MNASCEGPCESVPSGDPAAGLLRQQNEVRTQILPVGVSIDLDGLVQLRGDSKHTRPIRAKPHAKVVDAPARVPEDLDRRIA